MGWTIGGGRRWAGALPALALPALALPALALAALVAGAQQERPRVSSAPPEGPPLLVVGRWVTGSLARDETRSFRVEAPAGWYLRLAARQRGADLVLRLRGEELLAEADRYLSLEASELAAAVTSEDGPVTVEVEALADSPPGGYSLRLEALRPATAEDRRRCDLAQRARQAVVAAEDPTRLPAEADALAAEAIEIYRRLGDLEGEAAAWNTRGKVAARRKDPAEEEACYRRALALWQSTDNPAGQGEAFNNLGLFHRRRGEHEAAFARFVEAEALWRRAGKPQGRILISLGLAYRDRGETGRERASFERAREIGRNTADPYLEAIAANHLGGLHRRLGEPRQALELFTAARRLAGAAGRRDEEVRSLSNLGTAYRDLGRNQQALDAYRRAERLAVALGDRETEARTVLNQGSRYLDLGELEQARERYERALELYRQSDDPRGQADVLRNLGWLEIEAHNVARPPSGEPEQGAENRFARSLALSRGLDDRRREASALYGLGVAILAAGRPERALETLQLADRHYRDLAERQEIAGVTRNLGRAYLALGRSDEARRELERSLALAAEIENPAVEALALETLARLDRDQGRLEAAERRVTAALERLESVRTSVIDPSLRASFIAYRHRFYELAVDVLLRRADSGAGQGFAAAALEVSERSRARVLLELLAEAQVEVERGVDPELRRLEADADARLGALQSRLIQLLGLPAPPAVEVAGLRRRLEAVREERRQVEIQIRRRHPRYAEVRYPQPLGLAGIQALLADDTALLEYVLGDEEAYLFAITADGFSHHRLGPSAPLRRRIEEVRERLRRPGRLSLVSLLPLAHELYRDLVAPAEALLAGRSHLVIVPDGELFFLPFEVLPTALVRSRDDPAYLLERWTVSYAPSATVLESLARAPATGAGLELVAFADPVHAPGASREPAAAPAPAPETPVARSTAQRPGADPAAGVWALPRLVAAGAEAQRIAALFAPSSTAVYTREAASEARVKTDRRLATARYLHFAAHGLTGDGPFASSLVLTPGGEPPQDGLLELHEIFNLELGAELAVLSACDSGLGRQLRGEGVIGLSRGFFYAGAQSLVVSLWRVEDESTAELMVRFYRHLLAGEHRAKALAAAKEELRTETGYAHPRYWAPFVLLGPARERPPAR